MIYGHKLNHFIQLTLKNCWEIGEGHYKAMFTKLITRYISIKRENQTELTLQSPDYINYILWS